MSTQRPARRPVRFAAASLVLLAGCASRPAPQPQLPAQSQPMPAELEPPRTLAPPGPLSLASSIEAICATPAGKAVLDRNLPGLTTRPEFDMFKAMTLKQLEPLSKGHITDAVLAKVQTDLAALSTRAER